MADRQDRQYDRDRELWRRRAEAERLDRERDQGDYQGDRGRWQPERPSPPAEYQWTGVDYGRGRSPGYSEPARNDTRGRWRARRDPTSLEAYGENANWGRSSDWGEASGWGESDYFLEAGDWDEADDWDEDEMWADEDMWEAEAELEEQAANRDVGYTEFWLVPGPYTGVGPRGYQRARERIQEDVCDRLCAHGELDASDVEATVGEGGEVTLTGTVPDRWSKRLAEDVAASVRGVLDVHNRIRVRRAGEAPAVPDAGGETQPGRSQEAAHE